jgi:hypothetical protein
MPALFHASVRDFVCASPSEVVGLLSLSYARQGFLDQKSDQTQTWLADILNLQHSLSSAATLLEHVNGWTILLEFAIPRKGKRIDCVLITDSSIVILEIKSSVASSEAIRQVEEYALLLHYFHKTSSQKRIFPFVLAPLAVATPLTQLQQRELGFPELASTWIAPTSVCNWQDLLVRLMVIANQTEAFPSLSGIDWNAGAYHPVPSIIEAALALKTGLEIRDIAHSEASEHDIACVTATIQTLVSKAEAQGEFAICFLTGVPGSGKTLVGLSLAHSKANTGPAIHFMSGNGPLVRVLQHLFTKQAMRDGVPAPQAKIQARTLIENVHLFAKQYADDAKTEVPSNKVIIFDEAQRAWNKSQNMRKFKRNYSEPEMLLSIMERQPDWAAVIALVGGGQEINDGEAGLEEWGRALQGTKKRWRVFASPEVLNGGESTAGHCLFQEPDSTSSFEAIEQLHLRTSNRSIRSEKLAKWVNAVISGDAITAIGLKVGESFPLLLTRDLEYLRQTLRKESLAGSRFGLAASSNAARLRADGLEPDSTFHAEYPWEHWYLSSADDVRSSFQCEVFATEFEIQGLELDWVGLCWGGDFIHSENVGWLPRKFRPGPPGKWSYIKNSEKRRFRENAYRVLLTRARQGLVIFVPQGDADDPTRSPAEFDSTANFLVTCGVKNIDDKESRREIVPSGTRSLFSQPQP